MYPDPPVRGPHGYGRIDLKPGARPTCAHEYRMTGECGEAAERLSWEYLRLKLCEWAKPSGWRSPLFVLKKKDQNDWSEPPGVVDHRGPNSQTERDSYCLPIIDGILEPMGRRAMWSTIELSKAFHQVLMQEESRPITTTCLHFSPIVSIPPLDSRLPPIQGVGWIRPAKGRGVNGGVIGGSGPAFRGFI